MSVPLFKDLDKKANDILDDDYEFSNKLKVTNKTADGVTFTTEGTMGQKSILGKLSTKFSHSSGFDVTKLQVSTHGRLNLEGACANVVDGLKLTVKAEDGCASNVDGKSYSSYGRLGAEYRAAAMSATCEVDLASGPVVKSSALFGFQDFLLGGNVTANLNMDDDNAAAAVACYGGGLSYQMSGAVAALRTSKRCSVFDLSVAYDCCKDSSVASIVSFNKKTGATTATLGATWSKEGANYATKIDTAGVLSMAYSQTLAPKVKLGVSAQLDALNFTGDANKLGLQLTMN